MSHGLLGALGSQILADLARSRLLGALPLTDDLKGKRGRLPELAHSPTGEDMDARLRRPELGGDSHGAAQPIPVCPHRIAA